MDFLSPSCHLPELLLLLSLLHEFSRILLYFLNSDTFVNDHSRTSPFSFLTSDRKINYAILSLFFYLYLLFLVKKSFSLLLLILLFSFNIFSFIYFKIFKYFLNFLLYFIFILIIFLSIFIFIVYFYLFFLNFYRCGNIFQFCMCSPVVGIYLTTSATCRTSCKITSLIFLLICNFVFLRTRVYNSWWRSVIFLNSKRFLLIVLNLLWFI